MKHLLTCMGSRLLLVLPLFLYKPCSDADVSPKRKKTTPLQIQAKIHVHSKSELCLFLFQPRLPLRFSPKYVISTPACRPSGARECRAGCSAPSLFTPDKKEATGSYDPSGSTRIKGNIKRRLRITVQDEHLIQQSVSAQGNRTLRRGPAPSD